MRLPLGSRWLLLPLIVATLLASAPVWCPTSGAAATVRTDDTASAASVADLPLVEVTAHGDSLGASLVVWLTGDGGWDETDKGASAEIASRGVPVIGFDSLHYFRSRHEPDAAAIDLERVLRHYLAAWNKRQAVLVGYSMGGSVLPFLVNRLPGDLKPSVRAVVLLGPAREVDFKFHLTSWLGKSSYAGDHPVLPELEQLLGTRVLCFHGQEDKDCICPDLPQGLTEDITLHGGHRVGGHYGAIADSVVALAR
jgi:type IV secretory pathway VirJ component